MARASVAEWLGPSAGTPGSARWPLVGFCCAAMVAVVVFQWVYVETGLLRLDEPGAPDPAKVIAAYESSPLVTLPVTPDDPHRGPLTAPVQLVVFESLRCPHCQRFASTLSRLQREFGERLLVVYKHYPLSTRCNDRLGVDMQPGACELAWAAVAAQRQARFWQFHDAVMAPGARTSPEDIARTVRRLRLNPARFEADLHSDVTRECVAEDVALGNRLQLPGTPSAFLDGRLVSSTRPEVLEILVRHQLEGRKAGSVSDEHAAKNSGRPLQRGGPASGG